MHLRRITIKRFRKQQFQAVTAVGLEGSTFPKGNEKTDVKWLENAGRRFYVRVACAKRQAHSLYVWRSSQFTSAIGLPTGCPAYA
ncbi:hypothetical protein RJC98_10030 [Pseudomonas allii]|uniref:Uncharacterized protein n=1 Tax=Pseudomonas allii TaxID=2740531 RepID=A0ACC6LB43_9PSED|nr:hypothetical protein [Pseudomonas allii]MDR9875523.1 hypothetical protein [Pseudomonas allii]